MGPIKLDTLGPLDATNICYVFPLPTVLTLWDTWVYISTIYHSDETPHVEPSVNDSFGLRTILSVSNVDLDGHVRFW